jgi:hypothetical protein
MALLWEENMWWSTGSGEDHHDFSGTPEGTLWQKWVWGVIGPGVLAYLAYGCLATGKATLPGRIRLPLDGALAVAMGVVYGGTGLFLFCHYFLAGTDRYVLRDIGKMVGLVGVAGGFLFIAVSVALS